MVVEETINMNAVADLRPCPFCGSLAVALVGSFVRCGNCGAVGPYGLTPQEAAARWNDRVDATKPSAVMATATAASGDALEPG